MFLYKKISGYWIDPGQDGFTLNKAGELGLTVLKDHIFYKYYTSLKCA